MTVCLEEGQLDRARFTRGIPVHPSISQSSPEADDFGESDPESWPQFVLDWDEDGVPHLVDVDASIEWDGWRIPDVDQDDQLWLEQLGGDL